MNGDSLIRATIVGAMLAYAAAEWLRFRRPDAWPVARVTWTAGALLATVHAMAAFHFRHGWSQRDALASTAAQAAAVAGVDWGGGLFVNYAFLAAWAADAGYWWRSPAAYRALPASVDTARATIFAFMFFNGAVVFAHGPARLLGLICIGAALFAWWSVRT
jgi:hypothetical protein